MVPQLTLALAETVKRVSSIDPIIVGPGVKTGIQLRVSNPAGVGADRVVNAVAAKFKFGTPALVIDFGTATTFDVVSAEGNYEGGVICPGPYVSVESLVSRTAKLPRIELVWPKSVIGKNTVEAMQSGAVIGYACLVDGLIEKICEEAGPIEHVIATGGLGRLFAGCCKRIKSYEPALTLEGMRIIAEMNRE